MTQKIKNNNSIIFLLLVTFTVVIGIINLIIENLYSAYNTKKVIIDSAERVFNIKEARLNNFLESSKDQIVSVRNSNSFHKYLKNKDNDEEIMDLFLSYMKSHKNYMQFRYINKHGLEVLTVERKTYGGEVQKFNRINSKVKKFYYYESISKNDGEVWHSSFDLHLKGGEIEIPYKTTIRTIYPVVEDGVFEGILVINHFAQNLLDDLTDLAMFKGIIVNDKGEFISHYDKNKAWSKYSKSNISLKDEFPKRYKDILISNEYVDKSIFSKKLDVPLNDNLFAIFVIDENHLEDVFSTKYEQSLYELIILIFLSLIFSFIIMKLYGKVFSNYEQQKILYEEQKKLNDRLELASSISNIGFWELDAKSKLISVNQGFKSIFNIENNTLSFFDFISLMENSANSSYLDKLNESIESKTEYKFVSKIVIDNKDKYIEEKGRHFYNDEGQYIKTIGNVNDVTQKHLAEKLNSKIAKQAKEFKKLFDRFDENVIASTTNKKGIITYTSKAFCEISGFSKEELLGSPQNIVRHPDTSKEVFRELWETIQNGKIWYGELKNKTKEGGSYWVNAIIYPEFDDENNIVAYSAIRHDITAKKEVEIINHKTQSSINFSSFIQTSLLPSPKVLRTCVEDKFVIWEPKDTIGGDIYLLNMPRNENECLLIIVDCTGHGVPGAFVTMLVKAIERQIVQIIKSNDDMEIEPSWVLQYFNLMMKKILNQKNRALASNVGFDGGVLSYDKTKGTIKFAGASNNLIYYDKKEIKFIKGDRFSIGYKNSDENFILKNHEIKVEKGMKFYLHTDGFIDQIGGEKGFPFGRKRFINILTENIDKPMIEQKNILLEELKHYQKEYERVDDITVIGLEI